MRHQYRITKYNPKLRDERGAFQGDEWTSYSDIGLPFGGVQLSEKEYLKTEEAYLFAIEALLREAEIKGLLLRGLENTKGHKLPRSMRLDANLNIAQCVDFSRLALREYVWGKLVVPGCAYVHFGWDYYLYMGLPARCPDAVAAIQARGLFVEPFRSPHLRAHS